MDMLGRFFDFGGDRQLELFKAACSQRDPLLYLFVEEDEPWHQFLIKYLLPILEWRLSLFPEDDTPPFEIHGEQSLEVESENSGKLPEVALLNVFPMVYETRDYDLFLKQYEKFQNLYPFVFRCRPRFQNFVQVPGADVEAFVAHIKHYFGVPSLEFERMALDAVRFSFKEIERQAFLLQTKVARALPPPGFRTGQEPQEHLSARYLAYREAERAFPNEEIMVERRLFQDDPALMGNAPGDNLDLENHYAKEEEPDPERLEQFEEFRVPDLLVPEKAWIEIEDFRGVAYGDQDPFAAWQRKLVSKLPWIASCKELWVVLSPPIAAFFPEIIETVVGQLQQALKDAGARTRIRTFSPDYASEGLFELTLEKPSSKARPAEATGN